MKILDPVEIKNVAFKNRVVMAPVVRFGFPSRDGIMGEKLMKDYLDRADKGIGLIICQALHVSEEYTAEDRAGVYSDRHTGYLAQLAEAHHKNETRFFAQLNINGFGFYRNDSEDVNRLTKKELIRIRDAFIRGAEICKKAGLDGIELHGAHTFFLNMMASPRSNRRQDVYGGDPAGRLTLVKEITEGIRSFTGDRFIVSYRMGWGESLDADVETARTLERMGIDMLHVSFGIPRDRKLELPADFDYNDVVYTGCHVKKHVTIPVICVNGIRTLRRGNALIENNCCDFAAYGMPFLADPGFLEKSLEDMDYKPCLECSGCQWFMNGEKCPLYPQNYNL